jgi:hypothetical protein
VSFVSPQPASNAFLTFRVLCRYPNGELRVDLRMPGAEAQLTYDPDSAPSYAQIGANAKTKVIPAKLVMGSLSRLSGLPTAIHIHGPASRGTAAAPLVTLCSDNCPPSLLTESYEFSIAGLPIELVRSRSTYINVHTRANPTGEIRGQISPSGGLTTAAYTCSAQMNVCSLDSDLNMLQEGVTMTRSYTANSQQEIPPGPSSATASFAVTFHNNNGTVSFSSITTSGLSGLSAVHIHGPCPDRTPCNADVLYTVCGGTMPSCPSGASPTIPGFDVDSSRSSAADGSVLLGLMAQILSGNRLFYVNFHTAA